MVVQVQIGVINVAVDEAMKDILDTDFKNHNIAIIRKEVNRKIAGSQIK
jgi:hypothetical protein